jgi:hypothetical protein
MGEARFLHDIIVDMLQIKPEKIFIDVDQLQDLG